MTITRRALFGAPAALLGAALVAGCARKADVRMPDGEPDRFPRSYPPDPEDEDRRR